MHHIDLFSGIGGFALGSKLAGWSFDHSYYSNIDKYSNDVYAKNFPSSIALGDIRNIDGNALRERHPGPWVLTGGFPCQDISDAGNKRGIAGARSGLWYEMHRVIGELRPRLIVAENVSALAYRGLDRVLWSLAEIGYDAEWQVLPARAIGSPHLRSRLWIVAYPSDSHGDRLGLRLWDESQGARDLGEHILSNPTIETPCSRADWPGEITRRQMADRAVIRRVDDGLPPGLERSWRSRGKCLGNAIVPQVAELIFRKVASTGLMGEYGHP